MILQMIGRAGRPQYDATGVAVVMTAKATTALYENLGTESAGTIESTLESSNNLLELVNAEVASRTVTSEAAGIEWIRSTFMVGRERICWFHLKHVSELTPYDRVQFVRMQKNQRHYRLPPTCTHDELSGRLQALVAGPRARAT